MAGTIWKTTAARFSRALEISSMELSHIRLGGDGGELISTEEFDVFEQLPAGNWNIESLRQTSDSLSELENLL